MKVLKQDLRSGFFHVQVTHSEDLWYLSQFVEPGDTVMGKSERKVKVANDKVIKKTYTLAVIVERCELVDQQLRVLGKVVSEHDDIAKGSYQTIEVELHSLIKIEKIKVSQYALAKLDEAKENQQSVVLLLVFDREEACFGLLSNTGVQVLDSVAGDVEKKQFKTAAKDGSFYLGLLKFLQEYEQRFHPSVIILASPAFFKEDLLKVVQRESPELAKKCRLATCNNPGAAGLQEVLKRDELKSVLEQERFVQESLLMDEVLQEIATVGKATYGLKQVAAAVDAGAVRVLLVAESLVKDAREDGWYFKLDKLMRSVVDMKGRLVLLHDKYDAGKKLVGLSGIAALLRFKIE
ncbi:MAG: mRNA surveillance protein pelota [Nanoarchaeota archaeon]|nr:mRNA surveillance protein pelota [Nanoarchaeota archaeon]